MSTELTVPTAAGQRGIEPHQWNALRNAVFPGASDDMILLAVDYCKARNLDPLKKPVHIVPVWDNDKRRYVETVWEGINNLRVTASRTGEYAGMTDPEYGPEDDKGRPAWCKVFVYRVVKGEQRSYPGRAYWRESVATKKGGEPNAMWSRRPYSMLLKCAEADALRRAFPEECGATPTAEEMDGQTHIGPERAKDVTPAAQRDPLLDGALGQDAGVIAAQPAGAGGIAEGAGQGSHNNPPAAASEMPDIPPALRRTPETADPAPSPEGPAEPGDDGLGGSNSSPGSPLDKDYLDNKASDLADAGDEDKLREWLQGLTEPAREYLRPRQSELTQRVRAVNGNQGAG